MSEVIEATGVTVRREKLSRGPAYKVRSAGCQFLGDNVIFVDKGLPEDQQVAVMLNYLIELDVSLAEEDLALLSPANQDFLRSRKAA